MPVKAGSPWVGVTFVATNYRPNLDLIRQYERKSLEDNTFPQLQYYPAIGYLQIQGPFNATRPEDSPSLRRVITCHPAEPHRRRPARKRFWHADAPGVSPSADTGRYGVGAGLLPGGPARRDFQDGIELGLRRILISPQFLVRAEREPRKTLTGPDLSHHGSGTRLAPVVLSLEQHPRR